MVMTYLPVRVFFKKLDRCVYISHLDLMRTMGRAVSRSGIDAWYTMGFNPHLYMTFALPLSLGTASVCESMDFRVAPEENFETIVDRLNAVLPDGIIAYAAAAPKFEPKEIMWSDYKLILDCDTDKVMVAWNNFCGRSEVLMEKRSKKGMKNVDIREMFQPISCEIEAQQLVISLRCRAGVEINLNPTLVIEGLQKYENVSIHGTNITRTAVLTEDLVHFC